ncbi:hypothetical protein [Hoeflea sp. TYP-13]|uniref:hypothetical protein n=1 Tax=Hoeflea sp. TYP-13 TaxID=3230023 RepID=UPI0034C5F121
MFRSGARAWGPAHISSIGNALAGVSFFALAATLTLAPAAADDFTPYVSGEILFELENDNVFSSSDPDAEFNSLYPTVELAAIIGLTPVFSINFGLTMEQVADPDADNYFKDIGLYIDTVNIQAELMGATFVAGKFAPTFGKAWDETPGLFGTDLAEDYEISEMIGFGVAYPFDAGDNGTHTLSANAFFVDTTFMSESLFTNRGRVSTADGGPANTGTLDNFSITLDGEEISSVPGLSYNLGFTYLSAGVGDVADQTGYVFGLTHSTDLDNGATVGVIGEIAYFNNAGGTLDDATYYTAGLSFEKDSWHGELAGTIRQIDLAADGSQTTRLFQASGGYVFENEVDLTLGYAHVDEAGTISHTVGIQLSKSFSFATPGAPEEEFDLPERRPVRETVPTIVQ